MMPRRWMLFTLVLAAVFSLGLAACGDDDEAEDTAGDTVEDAAEEVGEAVDEAADEAGETVGVIAGDPEAGAAVFAEQGCNGCHSLDTAAAAMTGPPLYNIGTVAEDRTDQSAAAYIRQSIVDPGAYVVEGYDNVMPPYELSDDQLDDLVAYLLTLTE